MTRWVAFVATAALLLSGVAIGALATHLYWLKAGTQRVAQHRSSRPRPIEMMKPLQLTPEQQEQVSAVMRATWVKVAELREQLRPRVHELLEQSDERIREILTPEQQRRFDEVRREHQRDAEWFLFGGARGDRYGPSRWRHSRRPGHGFGPRPPFGPGSRPGWPGPGARGRSPGDSVPPTDASDAPEQPGAAAATPR